MKSGIREGRVDLSQFKMATAVVRCEPTGREVVVVHETNLMDAILQTGLGLGQSCDGSALCGFCRVTILDGADNLSPIEGEEKKVLTSMHAAANERLACRATLHGPVSLTTTYW